MSSFRNIDIVLGSCTPDKCEVSSANNLVSEVKPSGRSLIWNPEKHQLQYETNLKTVY